jgi:hypothetical protein
MLNKSVIQRKPRTKGEDNMIEQFVTALTLKQIIVIAYLIIYFLIYGVKYHLLALNGYLSGRGISNDWLGIALNWLGYASVACCLYWFV